MGQSREIRVPDIGDFDEVEVVELLVAKGDTVEVDDPLVSIESDKATMEIPSSAAGVVAELHVAEGDRVSEGTLLVILDVEASDEASDEGETADAEEEARDSGASEEDAELEGDGAAADDPDAPDEPAEDEAPEASSRESGAATARDTEGVDAAPAETSEASETEDADQPERVLSAAAAHPVPDRPGLPHASPLVRRFARELGVPIGDAEGSGPHGRVLLDDVKQHVRERFAGDGAGPAAAAPAAAGIPSVPAVDHAAFGPVHEAPLTRIQKVSGPALHRSWLNVPHVTQHDEADITELERFRSARKEAARERGLRLSPLLFVMKAVVRVLSEFERLRSSLAPEGDHLIVKDYYHLGIAVDTEQGLVVPVVRDVDRKGIFELAAELDETAQRARDRKLGPDDLRGACFTISSLGGIGGRSFSPIVNAPEVAILGVSQTRVQPVWQGPSPLEPAEDGGDPGGRFEPRLVLPFSLSYDHRVIDGAEAVRFTSRLARVLADPMQLLL